MVQAGLAHGQLDKECVAIDQCVSLMKLRITSSNSLHKTVASVTLYQTQLLVVRPSHLSTSVLCVCQVAELTHDKLDLVVMGQVMAGCFARETSSHRQQERGKSYTVFYHQGVKVCQKTFLFLHGIGYSRCKAIKASYLTRGVAARTKR